MIEFNNVSKKYDTADSYALKDININIEKGEFVFVVGSSGAGKSTFLKLMMREEVASSGSIIVDDYNLNKIRKRDIPKFRRKLGIVFQDFRLIPNMTVFDNVAFAMRVIGTKEKKIRRRVPYVLSLMGLNEKARKYPRELSGGEQQRVALARALANNAEIIIADEPTGNVDPQMSYEIVDMLMRLNEAGTTVIMVTHEHSLVRCFDKRVIILDKGNVVADGGTLIREAATSHINAASEISNEYVVPPDEDYSAYIPATEIDSAEPVDAGEVEVSQAAEPVEEASVSVQAEAEAAPAEAEAEAVKGGEN
ncbi:MAG: cell division ATP-binding protein FtsE [Clostridia bacterium]|nr:cell division ATP-binding protein FtsE [Clostridia bacterium]